MFDVHLVAIEECIIVMKLCANYGLHWFVYIPPSLTQGLIFTGHTDVSTGISNFGFVYAYKHNLLSSSRCVQWCRVRSDSLT